MISREEMKRISKKVTKSYGGLVMDNEYKYSGVFVEIPHLEEIIVEAIESLKHTVKSSIRRVNPFNSNIIIRVYRHTNMKIGEDIHWVWGYKIYFKTIFNGYVDSDNCELNFEEFTVTKYLFQDDSVILRPDFVDIYLKIK
jgi:hypothetical protein